MNNLFGQRISSSPPPALPNSSLLTDVLNLHIPAAPRTQIRPERAVEQLLQHLETDA